MFHLADPYQSTSIYSFIYKSPLSHLISPFSTFPFRYYILYIPPFYFPLRLPDSRFARLHITNQMLPLLSILLPAAHALFTHPSFPLHSLQLHHAKTPLCGSEPFLSGYFRVGPSLSSASPAEEEQQTVFSSPHEGVVEEENEDSKYFYTLITPSQNNKTTDPIILWLNGGPGCSSLTGAFFELGPCRIANEGKNVTENPYAWNRNATIVFLDQVRSNQPCHSRRDEQCREVNP